MKRIIKFILSSFQILLILATGSLQYLSDKKMGVARYLIFKKSEFEKTYFAPDIIKIYLVLALISFALICIILLYRLKQRAILAFLINFALIFLIYYKPIHYLKAGYFFIIALAFDLAIEYVKLSIK